MVSERDERMEDMRGVFVKNILLTLCPIKHQTKSRHNWYCLQSKISGAAL